MLPILRSRSDARRLARELRNSLASLDDDWKIGTDKEYHPMLSHEGFRIVLTPRAARLFDAIHVYCDGAEIWLPLVARLRLRAAARWRFINDATEHLQEAKLKKTRARRQGKKPAA